MFNLNTNYKDLNDGYGVVKEGKYEAVIQSVGEQATKSGSESIHFNMVIRNDINQAYKNSHIWIDFWKSRQTGQYNMDHLQYVLRAIGVPEGTAINSIEQFFNICTGKPVLIDVKVEESEYNGQKQERNRVAPWGWSTTRFPNVQHVWKESGAKNPNEPINVEAEDLPF